MVRNPGQRQSKVKKLGSYTPTQHGWHFPHSPQRTHYADVWKLFLNLVPGHTSPCPFHTAKALGPLEAAFPKLIAMLLVVHPSRSQPGQKSFCNKERLRQQLNLKVSVCDEAG